MRVLPVVALMLLVSCRWHGMDHPPLGGRGGGGATPSGSSTSEPTMTQKAVSAKQDPRTLIATDGSRCVVTDARYRDTNPGDKVWCVWTSGR